MSKYSSYKTVTEVFEAMERGEKLRWVPKTEVGRHREGDVEERELCIGNKIILDSDLAVELVNHSRLKAEEDGVYTDYELLEKSDGR